VLVDVVDAASQVMPEMDCERQFVSDRVRDLHDLWHVVTGYDRDLLGEYALLTFSYAQLGTPGFGLLIPLSYLFFGMQGAATRQLVRDAYRRGRSAPWLPAQDWEGMLERPLSEVRETLGLGPSPPYEQIRSRGAPAEPTGLVARP
jgi:ubiquinone biosynthesis protein COQ4